MKGRIMEGVTIFLAFVIAIDIFVLLTNESDKDKDKYVINSTNMDELSKELNETIENNKNKIERYEKIVEWNKNIIDNLK